jgi:dTDP-4-dehydrorhamnose 3,5-epimerase
MKFEALALAGAWLIHPEPATDARGFFARTYCSRELREQGLVADYPQHSISFNKVRGTLRGLHYQAEPHAETKIVRCTRGAIFDVIVDLRTETATRGRWIGVELTEANQLSLYVPTGFAHGFITLDDASEVLYMIDREHVPGLGRSLRWDDPALAIRWPLAPVLMSDNDRQAPLMRGTDTGKPEK